MTDRKSRIADQQTNNPADEPLSAGDRRGWPSGFSRPARFVTAGLVVALVLWQAVACYRLGGASPPAVDPISLSADQAAQMRERVNRTLARPGSFALEISDQELGSYIVGLLQSGAGEFPARDMQVRFRDGYVEIWATFIDVAPTDLPVYVRATVRAAEGQVVFYITQASVGTVTVPGAMREMIAQILSETLAEMELGLQVDEVIVLPDRIQVRGRVTGDVPELPIYLVG